MRFLKFGCTWVVFFKWVLDGISYFNIQKKNTINLHELEYLFSYIIIGSPYPHSLAIVEFPYALYYLFLLLL